MLLGCSTNGSEKAQSSSNIPSLQNACLARGRYGNQKRLFGRKPGFQLMPSLVKESEESVRNVTTPLDSEVNWQSLALEVANIGVWEWDFVHGEGRWSKGLSSLLGLSDEACALGPDGLLHFVHPDDQDRYRNSIHATLDGGSDHNLEYRILLPDNRLRWFLDRGRVLRNDRGEAERMIGAITDVTERKQEEMARRELERGANARLAAERALRETEDRFEAILDNAPAAVYVKDLTGKLTFVNRRFLELFGLTKEQVLEEAMEPIHPEEVSKALREHDREVLLAGHAVQFEEELVLGGERKTYLSVKFPLRDSAGEVYALCGISADISARKEAEQCLHERTVELQEAIDDINQLTYSVSHDMGSPIRGVIGNVRFLREELGDDISEQASNRLERIEMAGLKIAQLVDDLLSFTRLGRHEMRSDVIDVTDLAERVAGTIQASRDYSGKAIFEIQDNIVVHGDQELVGMALSALLENSVKYRKSGTTAHVKVRAIEGGFAVEDNGIGIDLQYEHKIFQPFERLHRDVEYSGTGIGLAKVRRIVERHGGKVWVESHPGDGATFYVRLSHVDA